MNRFQVALTEHAITDLRNIPEELRNQIHQDLNSLESAPYPSGKRIKRLRDVAHLFIDCAQEILEFCITSREKS